LTPPINAKAMGRCEYVVVSQSGRTLVAPLREEGGAC
jgi:hypothetical protein